MKEKTETWRSKQRDRVAILNGRHLGGFQEWTGQDNTRMRGREVHKVEDLVSKKDAITMLEIIFGCSACMSIKDASTLMEKTNSLIPFEKAVYGLAKLGRDGDVQQYNTINFSYPQQWLEFYRDNNFAQKDPIAIENFSTFGLQYWADTYEKRVVDNEFMTISHDFGLKDGYAWGCINPSGTDGCLLSVAGPLKKHQRDIYILTQLSPHLHNAFSKILHAQKNEKSLLRLTIREKEIIKWVRYGKSTWDISMILDISERTVKFHVDNIMKKLDAVSRAHAVAIALASGLIDFD